MRQIIIKLWDLKCQIWKKCPLWQMLSDAPHNNLLYFVFSYCSQVLASSGYNWIQPYPFYFSSIPPYKSYLRISFLARGLLVSLWVYAFSYKTRLKWFPFVFKRMELWNDNFILGLVLLNCKFRKLRFELYKKQINVSRRLKLANLDSLKCMHLSFSYVYKCMHLNAG